MIGNLPLVHINLGLGIHRAKGVIAIGAVAQGWLAIGYVAMGGICIGLVSLGLFAFAVLAFGLIAFGSFSFGVISMGAFAFGIFSMGAEVLVSLPSARRHMAHRWRSETPPMENRAGLLPCRGHLHADQQQTAF